MLVLQRFLLSLQTKIKSIMAKDHFIIKNYSFLVLFTMLLMLFVHP